MILAAWLRCSAKSRWTAGPSAAPQSSSRRQRSAAMAAPPGPGPAAAAAAPPYTPREGGGACCGPAPSPAAGGGPALPPASLSPPRSPLRGGEGWRRLLPASGGGGGVSSPPLSRTPLIPPPGGAARSASEVNGVGALPSPTNPTVPLQELVRVGFTPAQPGLPNPTTSRFSVCPGTRSVMLQAALRGHGAVPVASSRHPWTQPLWAPQFLRAKLSEQ